MRALGRKKTHVFSGNALPKSNARAHLKQRKKHSGLTDSQKIEFKTVVVNPILWNNPHLRSWRGCTHGENNVSDTKVFVKLKKSKKSEKNSEVGGWVKPQLEI